MTAPVRTPGDSTLDLSGMYDVPSEWQGAELIAHFDHAPEEVQVGNNPWNIFSETRAHFVGLTVQHGVKDEPLFVCAEAAAQWVPVDELETLQSERIG